MPLTSRQRKGVAEMRTFLYQHMETFIYGTAESVDQRSRLPDPELVPEDVTVRVEIAPPFQTPHPLLDGKSLKTPERVPVFLYAIHSAQRASEAANTRVIFFIHGGGNIAYHPTHPLFVPFYVQLLRTAAARLGDTSKCVLIAPSYRLATTLENTFPAALQDLVAAYDHIIDKGYRPSNIIFAGDSAGGNHALVLTHLCLQSGRQPPCGIVVIAPYAIQVHDQLSEYAKSLASTDILSTSMLDMFSSFYVGGSKDALTDPLVSGALLPFTAAWPRLLILVGSGDMLIDTSRELERRFLALNLPVELVEYDERPHGWWAMPHVFAEDIQDAAKRIAGFFTCSSLLARL